MPPTINPKTMFGSDEGGDIIISSDPAEITLQAAKEFKNKKKREKMEIKDVFPPETTEDNWEDEGGAFQKTDEEKEILLSIEDVENIKKSLISNLTAPYHPPLHPLYKKYNSLLKELIALRNKKGKDYGTEEDPFANVRGAQEFGVSPWIGAANSANDCMTRIKTYARTKTLENESVRDSMLDLANYSLIMLVLWEEENDDA